MSSLRHACLRSGACCHGVEIPLADAEERARVGGYAAALRLEDAIDGRFLRRVEGACALLSAEGCRLHAAFGPVAKPAACNQFPLVAVRVEGEVRAGVDPTCVTAWRTWRDGPALDAAAAVAVDHPLAPDQEDLERRLLAALAASGARLVDLLEVLGAGPSVDGDLQDGLGEALLAHLRRAPPPLDPGVMGAAVPSLLGPPLARVRVLEAPPPLALSVEDEAWALEVARRLLSLRLHAGLPSVQAVALGVVVGAVVCAWGEARPFGAALSAWVRALRSPGFAAAALPR